MEHREFALVQQLKAGNHELNRLYLEHQKLETTLDKLANRSYLTPAEDTERKQLKTRKLNGVEKMLKIVTKLQS